MDFEASALFVGRRAFFYGGLVRGQECFEHHDDERDRHGHRRQLLGAPLAIRLRLVKGLVVWFL